MQISLKNDRAKYHAFVTARKMTRTTLKSRVKQSKIHTCASGVYNTMKGAYTIMKPFIVIVEKEAFIIKSVKDLRSLNN